MIKEILPGIDIAYLALYIDSSVIISDVHIGYEESLTKQGVLIPRTQFKELCKTLEIIFEILKDKKIERFIINGDLKHEFGAISDEEWRNTLKFLDIIHRKCGEIIIVQGNHDTVIGPIANKRAIKVVKEYLIGKTLIIHGDKAPQKELLKKVSNIIIGHEHPAISLNDGPKTETFKCFVKSKYKGKNLIAQPSFNPMIPGTNILYERPLGPMLKGNIKKSEVYVVGDSSNILYFGKVKNIN